MPGHPPCPTHARTLNSGAARRVGSYLGNAIGCALGVFLLLNCGLMPQFTNAINTISVAKLAYPWKETFIKAGGGWVGPPGLGWAGLGWWGLRCYCLQPLPAAAACASCLT